MQIRKLNFFIWIFHLDDNVDVIELLLRHGADINAATTDHKNTPLHIAAKMGKSVNWKTITMV